MTKNEIIRSILTFLVTLTVLLLSFLVPFFPIYLNVLKQLSVPFALVIGGWFSIHAIKNYRK